MITLILIFFLFRFIFSVDSPTIEQISGIIEFVIKLFLPSYHVYFFKKHGAIPYFSIFIPFFLGIIFLFINKEIAFLLFLSMLSSGFLLFILFDKERRQSKN